MSIRSSSRSGSANSRPPVWSHGRPTPRSRHAWSTRSPSGAASCVRRSRRYVGSGAAGRVDGRAGNRPSSQWDSGALSHSPHALSIANASDRRLALSDRCSQGGEAVSEPMHDCKRDDPPPQIGDAQRRLAMAKAPLTAASTLRRCSCRPGPERLPTANQNTSAAEGA